MTPESALPFWTLVGELQHTANKSRLDHRSWVADEQLTELFGRKDPSALTSKEIAKCRRQTRYRARKHFDRQTLLREYALRRNTADDPHDDFETRDAANTVRQQVAEEDWSLLFQLAEGSSYATLAAERGISEGTLKSYVSRLRKNIRRRCPMVGESRSRYHRCADPAWVGCP